MTCSITAQRATIELEGSALSYLTWEGSGPLIVLLHGITSSAHTFWRIGADLAAVGYQVIVPDMPGHGQSSVSAEHTIDAIATIIGNMIMALDLDQLTLIGHSWGGAAALALASGTHPARRRLNRVGAIDPLLGMDPAWGSERLPDFSADLGRPAAELQPELRISNPDWPVCDIFWKAEALAQCRYDQVAGLFVHGGVWNLIERVNQIAVPLLVLVADPAFTIIPAATQAELQAQLTATGQLSQIPHTTHNMLRGPGYGPTMQALTNWLHAG